MAEFKKKPNSKEKSNKKNHSQKNESTNGIWLYGYHAVLSALRNSNRKLLRLVLSTETALELSNDFDLTNTHYEKANRIEFEQFLPKGAVHQGIAGLFTPLPIVYEKDIPNKDTSVVLILDQVTDPHNVGAIIRSALAFGADAIILTQRNAPEATGALAKSASGALEHLPLITVSNLARTMQYLKDNGYWCVGMDGRAKETIRQANLPKKVALVMGSEGFGLRRLTAENCDFMIKLPISSKVESLNVSNAAAIALYELSCNLLGNS